MQAGPHARPRAPHARDLARRLRVLAASLVVMTATTAAMGTAASAAPSAPASAKAPATPKLAKTARPARPVTRVKPVKLPKGTLEKLASKNDTDVLAALDAIRLAGPGAIAAAADIDALLDRGAHREVTVVALQTLGELGPSETESAVTSVASIVPYAGHRELSIRRAAVLALDGIHAHGEHALAALRRALGDADEEVRGSAARGLAQPEAARLAGDLVLAMDHKVAHAGLALGVACTGDTCVELAGRLDNSAPDTEAAAGLDRLVDRTDLPDETKARVLEKIGSSHTQAARVFLGSLRAGERWPKTASPALTKARDTALTEASGVR